MSNARNLSRLPQLGAGNATLMKNRIINGAMMIDQRNNGAIYSNPASNSYCLDRWNTNVSGSSYYTVQQNANSVTPPAGFKNYYGVVSTGVNSAATYAIRQHIEGYNVADLDFGKSSAKTVTLSFWVYASIAGLYSGALKNGAYDRSYVFTYNINSANTWQKVTITITGDTTGTWTTDNTTGMILWFAIGNSVAATSPSNNAWLTGDYRGASGTTNVMGTNGATFYLTGVQLEEGSQATGFEYRQYPQELALCQRYYEQVTYDYGGAITTGQAINAGRALANLGWTVIKRALPSVSITGTINVWNANATGYVSTNVSFSDASVNNVRIDCNSVTGNPLTAGNAAMIYPDVTDAVFKVSAEL